MITFKDLQDRVLRWIDESGDTNVTLAIVKDAIRAAHRRVVLSRAWSFQQFPRTLSFTTVLNQRAYALTELTGRLLYIWDNDKHQFVAAIPRAMWDTTGVDVGALASIPQGFTFGPVWPVAVQPATAGEIVSIVSSNGADVLTVVLEGLDASNIPVRETLTASGTTPVASTSAFSHITHVTKNGTWVGTLTVSAPIAGTLVTLAPTVSGRQFPTIEFTEAPVAGRVYQYRVLRAPSPLTNDTDIPDIWPNDCAEMLVYDALLDLTTYNTELGAKEQGLWTKRFDALYAQLLDATGENILGSYPRFVRDLSDAGPGRLRGIAITGS